MSSRPATLPPQDNATTALYRAALGPVGASYYLRVFGRFDEAGLPGPAWNTMAACFTLGWLIYRRLWGAAFSYAVLLAGLAAALWFQVGPWMDWSDQARWAAAAALAAALWLLPGFYANVLLHGELRRRMTEAVREVATVQQARERLAAQASGPALLGLLVFMYLVLASAAAGWWWQQSRGRPLPVTALIAPPAAAPVVTAVAAAEVPPPVAPPAEVAPPATPPTPPAVSAVETAAVEPPPGPPPGPLSAPPPAAVAEPATDEPIRPRIRGHGVAVGMFADASNAQRVEARLRDAGLPVLSDPVESSRGTLTRVRVGPFADKAAADAAARQIRGLGLEARVYGP
ncbi:SPOR domain-containing protein [uncultured Hydrogenophaga sp.]|uniref:SPOR domain-containing protein n=1 Tax=uncultured Hydrogenophaga sp. TaxID=199683 RepID=UPI00265E49F3|nr:SPOR domain-containing protein [uncultured Hydrogenophaga sp.]